MSDDAKKIKAKKFGKEFKEFLTKGNVISLAVGVVIGGAFQAIVKSLVDGVIMPIVGAFTANIDFSKAFWDITRTLDRTEAVYATIEEAQAAAHVVVSYGAVITAVLNFFIIGFIVFLIVKSINSVGDVSKKARKKRHPEPEAPAPEPTTKECPFCCSEIAIKASRCPNCTSELSIEATAQEVTA